jgi:hypothetical protein
VNPLLVKAPTGETFGNTRKPRAENVQTGNFLQSYSSKAATFDAVSDRNAEQSSEAYAEQQLALRTSENVC